MASSAAAAAAAAVGAAGDLPTPEWSEATVLGLLPFTAVVGIVFALFLWHVVSRIRVGSDPDGRSTALLEDGVDISAKAAEIQEAITEGARAFLSTEYKLSGAFMAVFAVIIFAFLASTKSDSGHSMNNAVFSTISFILGASTSMLSGYLGMMIATYANARTTLEARKGVGAAFQCAFRSGAVMGFLLTGLGLLVLYVTVMIYRGVFKGDPKGLYEAITGYGLGGSSMALFGRVGGGIYTKAADVGADLVGKVEKDIPEDDPRNPAVIADNVGDNVGDIAGMGADLFGSFAEATCAALVVSSVSTLGNQTVAMMYPLMITATSILVCLVTTLLATDIAPARRISQIETCLKVQLVVSTMLMAAAVYAVTMCCLPSHFFLTPAVEGVSEASGRVTNTAVYGCVLSGLIAGLIIGLVTEYYTSNTYKEVQEVADACKTGAATNIIFGLALGYKSCIVPTFCLAAVAYLSYQLAAFYGVACAALGMLGTLSTCLAIDAYGPIADNAGGIAEMAGMGEEIRERTDALDAAGNTTAAIGKGFAIGSAGLVSLALFGAYVTRAGIKAEGEAFFTLDIKTYAGLMVGAMLPYWFSAMTMKSVGEAALAMVEEVRRQFNVISGIMEGTSKPDYRRCVEISTRSSLAQMLGPGALVMLTPVVTGVLFGTYTLAGLLAGSLVSGIQIAISASNTGGAWDNAKKYLEAGRSEHARSIGGKGTEAHKAAVIGDTVGDPLKDTSGPSLNILIKLMAVESLVFAPFFASVSKDGLIFKLFS